MASLKFKGLNSLKAILDACVEIVDFWSDHGHYIQLVVTDKRSLNANALQHEWYSIIAKHTGSSAEEVKDFCKYEFGRNILLKSDEELSDLLNSVNWPARARSWKMSVEDAKRLAFSKMSVTSVFSSSQSMEYMDAMKSHYQAEGFTLPSKKDLG